jgi:hypothetical protein
VPIVVFTQIQTLLNKRSKKRDQLSNDMMSPIQAIPPRPQRLLRHSSVMRVHEPYPGRYVVAESITENKDTVSGRGLHDERTTLYGS